jgi:hypothetical protein
VATVLILACFAAFEAAGMDTARDFLAIIGLSSSSNTVHEETGRGFARVSVFTISPSAPNNVPSSESGEKQLF